MTVLSEYYHLMHSLFQRYLFSTYYVLGSLLGLGYNREENCLVMIRFIINYTSNYLQIRGLTLDFKEKLKSETKVYFLSPNK